MFLFFFGKKGLAKGEARLGLPSRCCLLTCPGWKGADKAQLHAIITEYVAKIMKCIIYSYRTAAPAPVPVPAPVELFACLSVCLSPCLSVFLSVAVACRCTFPKILSSLLLSFGLGCVPNHKNVVKLAHTDTAKHTHTESDADVAVGEKSGRACVAVAVAA